MIQWKKINGGWTSKSLKQGYGINLIITQIGPGFILAVRQPRTTPIESGEDVETPEPFGSLEMAQASAQRLANLLEQAGRDAA